MKRFRITAIAEKPQLLNSLVIEKFQTLELLEDVKVVNVENDLNSHSSFKIQKIEVKECPIMGVDFRVNYTNDRVDYILTVKDNEDLDNEVTKKLLKKLKKTKQFNRYAIELKKSAENPSLVKMIESEIGHLERFMVNIINSSIIKFNGTEYNFTKRLENEGYDLKNIVEINNNPSKEEAISFIDDIDQIIEEIRNV